MTRDIEIVRTFRSIMDELKVNCVLNTLIHLVIGIDRADRPDRLECHLVHSLQVTIKTNLLARA